MLPFHSASPETKLLFANPSPLQFLPWLHFHKLLNSSTLTFLFPSPAQRLSREPEWQKEKAHTDGGHSCHLPQTPWPGVILMLLNSLSCSTLPSNLAPFVEGEPSLRAHSIPLLRWLRTVNQVAAVPAVTKFSLSPFKPKQEVTLPAPQLSSLQSSSQGLSWRGLMLSPVTFSYRAVPTAPSSPAPSERNH